MGDATADSVTLSLLMEAQDTVRGSPLGVVQTPMVRWGQTSLPPPPVPCDIHIKLENMQKTGGPLNKTADVSGL